MLNFPIELGPFRRVILLSLLTGLAFGFPIGKSIQTPKDSRVTVKMNTGISYCPAFANSLSEEETQLANLGKAWAHESLECPFFTEGDKFHPTHVGTMTESACKRFKEYFGEIGLGPNQTRIYALYASIFKSDESKTGYLMQVVLNAPESELPSYQARFEIKVVEQGSKLLISDLKAKQDYKVSLQKFIKIAHEKALGQIDEKAIRLLVETPFNWSNQEIAKLDMATKLSPDLVLAHIKKSRIHAINKDYKSSLSDLNEVVRILPGNSNARIARAVVRSRLDDFEGAVRDLNRAIKMVPNSDIAYFYRGRAFLELNKFDQALFDFSQAEKLNPAEPAYPGESGKALFYKKQFFPAIAKFDQCLKMKGNSLGYKLTSKSYEVYIPGFFTYKNRSVLFDRGLAYQQIGDKTKAKQDYQMVLNFNNSYESKLEALCELAKLRKGQDTPDRIIADFDTDSKPYQNCKDYSKIRQLLIKELGCKG